MGHLLPGGFFLLTLLAVIFVPNIDFHELKNIPEIGTLAAAFGGSFLLAAMLAGLFFDALRTILDRAWDKCTNHSRQHKSGINWRDIFFKGDEATLKKFDENYFSYYVSDVNLFFANLILLLLIMFLPCIHIPPNSSIYYFGVPIILAGVFFWDATKIRDEFIPHVEKYLVALNDEDKPPHDGVYTRLARSDIHGVGVFAIKSIKKDTAIFYNDDLHMTWVDAAQLSDLPSKVHKLYDDFAVLKEGKYGCPRNFNLMAVSWYLNNSKTPNVRCGEDYQFYALRDIREGEELTVDYDTYSESPNQ